MYGCCLQLAAQTLKLYKCTAVLRNCIALHCIALHCIALHCIALHCIALHCIALHCIALHCIALHGQQNTCNRGKAMSVASGPQAFRRLLSLCLFGVAIESNWQAMSMWLHLQWMWTIKVYGSTGCTPWTSSSVCVHDTSDRTMCTSKVCNAQSHAMQIERRIYDAASRAVQHQRNPDGSVKQDAVPAEPAVHDAASTSQPAGVIKLNCMDHQGC